MAKRTPSDDYDSPWKDALQRYLREFLAFFFPDIADDVDWGRGYEALDKEFQQIIKGAAVKTVFADNLFQVWRKNGREAWLLTHVEVQGQRDATFPKRMFRYNTRAWDLHDRPVISLAILCDDQPT